MFTITFNLDTEEPVKLSKVSYLNMLRDLMLEGDYEREDGCGNGAVVNMHNNNYGSMTIVTTVMIEHCLVHVASDKCQTLYQDLHELLVPTTT